MRESANKSQAALINLPDAMTWVAPVRNINKNAKTQAIVSLQGPKNFSLLGKKHSPEPRVRSYYLH